MLDLVAGKNLNKPSPAHYEQPIIKFKSTASMYFLLKLGLCRNLPENHSLHLKNFPGLDLIKLRNPFHSLNSVIKNAKLQKKREKLSFL